MNRTKLRDNILMESLRFKRAKSTIIPKKELEIVFGLTQQTKTKVNN